MIYLSREAILRVIMANMVDAKEQETRQALADVGEELLRMDKALEEEAQAQWARDREAAALAAKFDGGTPCTSATSADTVS